MFPLQCGTDVNTWFCAAQVICVFSKRSEAYAMHKKDVWVTLISYSLHSNLYAEEITQQ